MGLRPEALRLTAKDPILSGRVAHVENLGSELFAQIALEGEPIRVTLRASPSDRHHLKLQAQVGLTFTLEDALIFDANGKRHRRAEVFAPRSVEVA